MIEYYLYRHIRLDKNEPFYIGKGHKKTTDEYPLRAFIRAQRNSIWNNIVRKTGYDVEIIYVCESESEINRKEVEFIALYGRKDTGTGTLANLTDGGEGVVGATRSKEWIEKLRQSKIGHKQSAEVIEKRSSAMKANTKNIERLVKMNKSLTSASFSEEHRRKLSESRSKQIITEETKRLWSENRSKKPIIQMTLADEFIKEWKSAAEVKRVLGFNNTNISRSCTQRTENIKRRRPRRSAYGFLWEYKNTKISITS